MADQSSIDPDDDRMSFRFAPAVLGIAFTAIGVLALLPDVNEDIASVWAVILAALGGAGLIATVGQIVQSRNRRQPY